MKAVESVFLFIFFVAFGACIEQDLSVMEPLNQEKDYPLVERALWPHFAAFERAAEERGYQVDLSRLPITGVIENIDDENVAGSCSYGGRSNHRDVRIDQSFWNRASHLSREYIVFHELGHCFLGRGHTEACLANRTYASLMRSGLGSCRDNYRVSTRAYYLDELFTPQDRP